MGQDQNRESPSDRMGRLAEHRNRFKDLYLAGRMAEAFEVVRSFPDFYREPLGFGDLVSSPSKDIRSAFRVEEDGTDVLRSYIDCVDFRPLPPEPRLRGGIDRLKRIVDQFPDWRFALNLLARMHLENANPKAALDAARASFRLKSNCPFGESLLGEAVRGLTSGDLLHGIVLNDMEQALLLDFKGFICPMPFANLEIWRTGEAFVCCGSWVPASIGNVFELSAEEIWDSAVARELRRSVLEGDYTYCSRNCMFLRNGLLLKREDLLRRDLDQYKALWGLLVYKEAPQVFGEMGKYVEAGQTGNIEGPRFLNLAQDDSCNLSCPSCRGEPRKADREREEKLALVRDRVILPMLPHVRELLVSGDGDPFASNHYRSILALLKKERYPHLRLSLLTNGVLFSEPMWRRFPNLQDFLYSVSVSVDAASPETYRVLRRGGSWDKLTRNLEFLGDLHRRGTLPYLDLNFVVQRENFREMIPFAEMGERLGVDQVRFVRLHNDFQSFSPEGYREKNVYDPANPHYPELIRILSHPVFQNPRVLYPKLPSEMAAAGSQEERKDVMIPGAQPDTLRMFQEQGEVLRTFDPELLRSVQERLLHLAGLIEHPHVVLAFSHSNYLTSLGGTEKVLHQEQAELAKNGISYLQIYGDPNREKESRSLFDQSIALNVDGRPGGIYTVGEMAPILQILSRRGGVEILAAHVHHLMNLPLGGVKYLIKAVNPRVARFFIHDYFTLCPQFNLLRDGRVFCGGDCVGECSFSGKRASHLAQMNAFFSGLELEAVAPSETAAELWKKGYPGKRESIKIIPHLIGREIPFQGREERLKRLSTPGYRPKISYLGYESLNKGLEVWWRLVSHPELRGRYEFFHLGAAGALKPGVRYVDVSFLKEGEDAMVHALNAHEIDAVFLWSVWPETYSFTLHEAFAANCFVITNPGSGNIQARVKGSSRGAVFESEKELFDFLKASGKIGSLIMRNMNENSPLTLAWNPRISVETAKLKGPDPRQRVSGLDSGSLIEDAPLDPLTSMLLAEAARGCGREGNRPPHAVPQKATHPMEEVLESIHRYFAKHRLLGRFSRKIFHIIHRRISLSR